jgi:hypothetical protein
MRFKIKGIMCVTYSMILQICFSLLIFFFHLQANDVECYAFLSDWLTHDPNGPLVFPHVNFHDVQRMVVFSCCCGSWSGVLFIRMEKICHRRRYGTLSLI